MKCFYSPSGQAMPPASIPLAADAFAASDATALYWLTGAGFLLNSRGTLLLVDPALTLRAGAADMSELGMRLLRGLPMQARELPAVDAVLYTHTDDDHLAPETAKTLIRRGAAFAGPAAIARRLEELGASAAQCRSLRIGETLRIGAVDVTLTRADHPWQESDPARYGPPHGPEDCCGFRFDTPDGAIWLPGDTRFVPELLDVGRVDALLLDVSDDPYHLGREQEIRLANHYADARLIPYHYGSYDAPDALPFNGDPAALAPWIDRADARLRILAPGEPFVLRRAPARSGL